jgi:hypothetical protein
VTYNGVEIGRVATARDSAAATGAAAIAVAAAPAINSNPRNLSPSLIHLGLPFSVGAKQPASHKN